MLGEVSGLTLVIEKVYTHINPLRFFDLVHKDDPGLVIPETIAREYFARQQEHFFLDNKEQFEFILNELVSNCYFSQLELIYRSHIERQSLRRDEPSLSKNEIITKVKNEKEKYLNTEQFLQVSLEEHNDFYMISILTNVMPHSISKKRIIDRLKWTQETANAFIMDSQSEFNEYFSMTGYAGLGIYMCQKEIRRYSGKLHFIEDQERGLSGYKIIIPRPIQYQDD